MGWCAEFACDINSACASRMVAGKKSCSCSGCGATCSGRYPGCAAVWAAGPTPSRGSRPPLSGRAGRRVGRPTGEVAAEAVVSPLRPPVPAPAPTPGTDAGALASMQVAIHELQIQMRTTLTMLSQQQSILALLVDDRRAAGPSRPAPLRPRPPDRCPTSNGSWKSFCPRRGREIPTLRPRWSTVVRRPTELRAGHRSSDPRSRPGRCRCRPTFG